ncbi:MAG: AAA family ATPase [bacterium]
MSTTQCSVCGTGFVPRFAFQVQRTADEVQYFCSQTCHEDHLFAADSRECSVCHETFRLQFAFQQVQVDGETRYFCSADCRQAELTEVERRRSSMRRIAVLNQKGGTGKTTTSVNVAAGLADMGYRVLLMDLDAQGNVAVSLGLSAQYTLYHVLVDGQHPTDCIVPVAPNLDAIISNTSLAQAEARLVTAAERYKVLAQRMARITNYDYVIMDCAPSLSVLNQNALTFADHILIPVSCDYLSLVGVRQVLRTLKKVNEILLQPVSVLGVVPTFYDKRTKISAEAMSTLQAYFQDKVFTPIHVNTRLKEAPSHKKTIFEHDPDGRGAEDYRTLVREIAERCGTTVATTGKESEVGVQHA